MASTSNKFWELDNDTSVWGGFGSRQEWEEAYKREHGYYPGEGKESYEESVRNLMWSQEYWVPRHGTQPMTEEVWKAHYYRPADFEDFGQYEQRARNFLTKYRDLAMQPVQYQPVSGTTAGGASTTQQGGVGAKANQFPVAQGTAAQQTGFGVPPMTGIQYPQPIGPQPAPKKPPVNPWALPTTPPTTMPRMPSTGAPPYGAGVRSAPIPTTRQQPAPLTPLPPFISRSTWGPTTPYTGLPAPATNRTPSMSANPWTTAPPTGQQPRPLPPPPGVPTTQQPRPVTPPPGARFPIPTAQDLANMSIDPVTGFGIMLGRPGQTPRYSGPWPRSPGAVPILGVSQPRPVPPPPGVPTTQTPPTPPRRPPLSPGMMDFLRQPPPLSPLDRAASNMGRALDVSSSQFGQMLDVAGGGGGQGYRRAPVQQPVVQRVRQVVPPRPPTPTTTTQTPYYTAAPPPPAWTVPNLMNPPPLQQARDAYARQQRLAEEARKQAEAQRQQAEAQRQRALDQQRQQAANMWRQLQPESGIPGLTDPYLREPTGALPQPRTQPQRPPLSPGMMDFMRQPPRAPTIERQSAITPPMITGGQPSPTVRIETPGASIGIDTAQNPWDAGQRRGPGLASYLPDTETYQQLRRQGFSLEQIERMGREQGISFLQRLASSTPGQVAGDVLGGLITGVSQPEYATRVPLTGILGMIPTFRGEDRTRAPIIQYRADYEAWQRVQLGSMRGGEERIATSPLFGAPPPELSDYGITNESFYNENRYGDTSLQAGWTGRILTSGQFDLGNSQDVIALSHMGRLGYTFLKSPDVAMQVWPEMQAARTNAERDAIVLKYQDPVAEIMGMVVADPLNFWGLGTLAQGVSRIPGGQPLADIMQGAVSPAARLERDARRTADALTDVALLKEEALRIGLPPEIDSFFDAVGRTENFLTQPARFEMVNWRAMDVVQGAAALADNPAEFEVLMRAIASGENLDALAARYGEVVYTLRATTVGGGLRTPEIRVADVLADAQHYVNTKGIDELNWALDMAARYEQPVAEAALRKAPIVSWWDETNKIKKVGKLYADAAYTYRTVLSAHALYMRIAYAVRNALSDTFLRFLDLGPGPRASQDEMKAYLTARGWRPRKMGVALEQSMAIGPISETVSGAIQKIAPIRGMRNLNQRWEEGRYLTTSYYAYKKAEAAARFETGRRLIAALPPALQRPEITSKVNGIIWRAPDAKAARQEVNAWLANPAAYTRINVLEFLPAELKRPLLADGGDLGRLGENIIERSAQVPLTPTDQLNAYVELVGQWREGELQRLGRVGVSGDLPHYNVEWNQEWDYRVLIDGVRNDGQRIGVNPNTAQQYTDGAAQDLDALHQAENQALTEAARQMLKMDMGEDGPWLMAQVWKQAHDGKNDFIYRAQSKRQEIADLLATGRKPEAAELWQQYFPWAAGEMERYIGGLNELQTSAILIAEQLGPGIKLTDVLPPEGGRFVARDAFIEQHFADMSAQAPVEAAAITGYRGGPFGANNEAFNAMLEANRNDADNRLSALWVAAADADNIKTFEMALNAQWDAALNWQAVAARKTALREAVWLETEAMPIGPAKDARWQKYFDDVNRLVQEEGWANEKRYYDEALARIKGMGGEMGEAVQPRTPQGPTPARMPTERPPETVTIPETQPLTAFERQQPARVPPVPTAETATGLNRTYKIDKILEMEGATGDAARRRVLERTGNEGINKLFDQYQDEIYFQGRSEQPMRQPQEPPPQQTVPEAGPTTAMERQLPALRTLGPRVEGWTMAADDLNTQQNLLREALLEDPRFRAYREYYETKGDYFENYVTGWTTPSLEYVQSSNVPELNRLIGDARHEMDAAFGEGAFDNLEYDHETLVRRAAEAGLPVSQENLALYAHSDWYQDLLQRRRLESRPMQVLREVEQPRELPTTEPVSQFEAQPPPVRPTFSAEDRELLEWVSDNKPGAAEVEAQGFRAQIDSLRQRGLLNYEVPLGENIERYGLTEHGSEVMLSDTGFYGTSKAGIVKKAEQWAAAPRAPETAHLLTQEQFLSKRPPVEGYLYHGTAAGDLAQADIGKGKFNPEGIGFFVTENRLFAEPYKGDRGAINYVHLKGTTGMDMDAPADMAFWRQAFPQYAEADWNQLLGITGKSNMEMYFAIYARTGDWLPQEDALRSAGIAITTHLEPDGTRAYVVRDPSLVEIVPPAQVHRRAVEQALQRGEEVPPGVLREYGLTPAPAVAQQAGEAIATRTVEERPITFDEWVSQKGINRREFAGEAEEATYIGQQAFPQPRTKVQKGKEAGLARRVQRRNELMRQYQNEVAPIKSARPLQSGNEADEAYLRVQEKRAARRAAMETPALTPPAKTERAQLQQDIRDAAIKKDVESATKSGKPQEQHIIRKWLKGSKAETLDQLSMNDLKNLQAKIGGGAEAATTPTVGQSAGEAAQDIFVRAPTAKEKVGGTARARGFNSIPDAPTGYEKGYKPYGAQGAGYYYTPKAEAAGAAETTPTAAQAKEPWQMRRHEFNAANPAKMMEGTRQGLRITETDNIRNNLESAQIRLRGGVRGDGTKLTAAERERLHADIVRMEADLRRLDHRYAVEQALREGYPVPAEVLADYPDLAAKGGAPPTPPTDIPPTGPQIERRTGPESIFGKSRNRPGAGVWQNIEGQWMPAYGGAESAIPTLEQTVPITIAYLDKLEAELERLLNDPDIWRQIQGQALSIQEQQALRTWAATELPRHMNNARVITQKLGQGMAEFSAGSPQKQYIWDMILSGIVPYPYWITRQGMNMIRRIATRPGILNQIVRHERIMDEKREKGVPVTIDGKTYMTKLPARTKGTTSIRLPDGSYYNPNILGVLIPGYDNVIGVLKPSYWQPEDDDGGKRQLADAVRTGRELGEPNPWLLTIASILGLVQETPSEIWGRALRPAIFQDIKNLLAVAGHLVPELGIPEGGWDLNVAGLPLTQVNKYNDHYFRKSANNAITRGLVTQEQVQVIDLLWQDVREEKMTPEQAIAQYPAFAQVWQDYVDSYLTPQSVGPLTGIYGGMVSQAELAGKAAREQRVDIMGESPGQRAAEKDGKAWMQLTGDEKQEYYEDNPNLRYQDDMYWLDWAQQMPEAQQVNLDFNMPPDEARGALASRAFWDVEAQIPAEAMIRTDPLVADVLDKENRDSGNVELGDYLKATAILYAWLATQRGERNPPEVEVLGGVETQPTQEMVTDYDTSSGDFWDLYYRAKDAGVLVEGYKYSKHPKIAPLLSRETRDAVTPQQWIDAAKLLAEALGETYTPPDLSVRPIAVGDEREMKTAEQRWRMLFRERDEKYPNYKAQQEAYKQATDKSAFYDEHPDYEEAQDWFNAQIEADPLLKKYYGPVPYEGEVITKDTTTPGGAAATTTTTSGGKATQAEVTYAERNGRATGEPTTADYAARDQIDAQVEGQYPGWGALRKQYLAIPVENTDARRAFRDAYPEYERGYDMRQGLLEQYAPALATVVDGQVFYYNGPRAAANRIERGEARFRVPLYQNLRGSEWGGGYGGGGSFRSPIQYRGIQRRQLQPVQWRGIGNVWRLPELTIKGRGM